MSESRANEARGYLDLVHHHPGRLRVRADAFRENAELAAAIRASLEALPGITRVVHNVQTGSLLIEYEAGHAEPDAIVERIAEAANLVSPFDPSRMLAPRGPARSLIDGVRGLNDVAKEISGGQADLRIAVPTALAGLAAASFVFDKNPPRWPRWDNLLYWSYQIFMQLHAREIASANDSSVAVPAVPMSTPEPSEP
jgi:hypothetical protein